jgi:hypothetical protein
MLALEEWPMTTIVEELLTDSTTEEARPPVIRPEDLQERIRMRAYELFEARNRESGHDLEDWLQAEAEIALTWPVDR